MSELCHKETKIEESAILKRTFRGRNKNCGCAHEVAGDNQQQRMPAVAFRNTFGGGVASAFQ